MNECGLEYQAKIGLRQINKQKLKRTQTTLTNTHSTVKIRGLKLKGTRGPHEYNIFELCVIIQFFGENKENNSIFPFKSSFFLMFAGRVWPAGRVFETHGQDHIERLKEQCKYSETRL